MEAKERAYQIIDRESFQLNNTQKTCFRPSLKLDSTLLWSQSYTSLEYQWVVSSSLSDHWTEFMIKITICDISVSVFYINKVTALMTFPVQTYLVDIQEETLIPSLLYQ